MPWPGASSHTEESLVASLQVPMWSLTQQWLLQLPCARDLQILQLPVQEQHQWRTPGVQRIAGTCNRHSRCTAGHIPGRSSLSGQPPDCTQAQPISSLQGTHCAPRYWGQKPEQAQLHQPFRPAGIPCDVAYRLTWRAPSGA